MENKKLLKPSKQEIDEYLNEWNNLEGGKYLLQENSLHKLFQFTYPDNNDINDILIKCSSLNDFYSTNIYSIINVARHIENLNIDQRLKEGDLTLVKDIAIVKIKDKVKHFYSFASKYCSHHKPDKFPIYDSYVEKVLMYYKSEDNFAKFKEKDLRDYEKFNKVLGEFKNYYNLEGYSLKEIDRYLWQLGKKYFKKVYENEETIN